MNLTDNKIRLKQELGFEVWCHPKDAPKVWDKLMDAGKNDGLIPAGFAALDKLRIEAGLILFGNEFDGQQDPFEAGIGFSVPVSYTHLTLPTKA